MPRLVIALALCLALAVAGCTGSPPDADAPMPSAADGQVAEVGTPAPRAEETDEAATPEPAEPSAVPRPDPADAADGGDLVLEPGLTDAPSHPGDPLLVAIGDSIAAGTGLARPRDGFVWRVHRAIADAHDGAYGLENLAAPGATSDSVLEGEQLARAEELLAQREVDVVVISVGGNDLLGLLAGVCSAGLGAPACTEAVDEAVAEHAGNLDALLTRLRDADPDADAELVVLQQYNPFDLGFGSAAERRAREAILALNEATAEVAGQHGARVADGYAAMEGRVLAGTGMASSQPDFHPSARGHDLLAVAVLEALRG